MKAARIANADSFIRRLPDGYDTMLYADGSNLSQGQRQLTCDCESGSCQTAGAYFRRSDQFCRYPHRAAN